MTSKKKILTTLSVVLILGLAVLGILAYLTSTASDVNVMTTGQVKIQQNEQQRVIGEDGLQTNELESFEQGKVLMPYTVRDPKPADNTLTVGEYTFNRNRLYNNYVDKIVSVTNTGKSDAYVRTLIAIPTGGSDWETTPTAAADVWLHWNTITTMNTYWDSYYTDKTNYAVVFTEINGQGYYVWEFTHKAALEPEKTTFPTLLGMFMDNRVNHDDTGYFMDMNSNGKCDEGEKRIEDVAVGDTVDVLVLSQAVQTDGFANAQTALDTAFGDVTAANAAEWFGGMEAPAIPVGYEVNNSAELAEAIEDGETEIWLNPNTYNVPAVAKGKTLTINGTEKSVLEIVPAGQGEANGQLDYNFDGSNVTFNGITIKTNSNTYAGYARLTGTYNNCVIDGHYSLQRDSKFTDCIFNVSGDQYNVWTWGAANVSFEGCTFNCDGKAILVYNQSCNLIVTNCTFNDSNTNANVSGKAAIEACNGDNGINCVTHNITVKNATVNGFDVTNASGTSCGGTSLGTTLWGNKNLLDDAHLNVTVDGRVEY